MRTFGLTLLLCCAPAFAAPPAAWQVLPETTAASTLATLSPAAVRGWPLAVDGASLAQAPAELLLPLAAGAATWQRVHAEPRAQGLHWVGSLAGSADYQASLTWHAGQLRGLVSAPEGLYEITSGADGHPWLVELDDARFPACGGAVHVPAVGGSKPMDTDVSLPRSDTVDNIEILVVYTAQVRAAVGGTDQALALAQASIDSSNTAFANSNMAVRFRLVGARETSLAETGTASEVLGRVRADATVAAWRNELGADMVGMIVENLASACGIGYLMGAVSTGFAPSAYQVTARGCAVGNLSFAHEHGHNMGMTHNPENGSGAAYPYGYGHWVNGNFRTVMSYSNPCTSGCTRRPYFSNPTVSFNGVPTGIANQRDNARAGNEAGPTVAQFRTSLARLFGNGFE
jgi:hypothetical protein